MSRSERDLVEALRAELAGIDPARPCDRAAEAAGLGPETVARDGPAARLAVRLRRTTMDDPAIGGFDWDSAADHCRSAWLRGHFLARGSLSLAGGRTHLEFVVPAEDAPVLAARLHDLGLPASWRLRRGRGVVTWKSAESVGMFLRRVGASGTLLELEARQVSRALRGELNRVLNAESANLQRAVSAAGRQLDAIAVLEADGRLAVQSITVRTVAAARLETPEATLSELAERLVMHRSAVQRSLERLENLVLHDDQGAGRRSASARCAGGRPARRAALA
jgi:DNA-binding protein WhiA